MVRKTGWLMLIGLLLTLGCSGPAVYMDGPSVPAAESSPLLKTLRSFPGVEVETAKPYSHFNEVYDIMLKQPLDHNDPEAGEFRQWIRLSHVDLSQPVVLITEGYTTRARSNPVQELSEFLNANQVRVEHRYFGKSMPDSMIWDYLNIKQAAADHHRIVALFKTIYPGKWVSTGWSKGGQTAMYHRRFYPEDVHVTVAYDSPLNFSLEDPRIDAFFDNVGTEFCRKKLIQFQRIVLSRKDTMLPLVQSYAEERNYSYSIGEEKALEYVVLEYPFSFWQYHKIDCDSIPDKEAPDQKVFDHLKKVVSFSSYTDRSMNSQSMYQFSTELGYYGYVQKNVKDLLSSDTYPNSAYAPQVASLKYRPEPMLDINQWLQEHGERMLYIYAELDPWSAPGVEVAEELDALKMTLKGGNHFTFIRTFPEEEREIILGTLERWLGVEIDRE